MALAIPARFDALMSELELVQGIYPVPSVCKPRAAWTSEEYGDNADGTRNKGQRFRTRRHLTAWQAHCLAYGLPKWSRYVPCFVCHAPIDAWKADRDHLESFENDGRSSADNMGLLHPACNRQDKVGRNAHYSVRLAFQAVAHNVTYYRYTPNGKGDANQRAAYAHWNLFPRLDN